jgi:hypothetical protein
MLQIPTNNNISSEDEISPSDDGGGLTSMVSNLLKSRPNNEYNK